MGVPDILDFSCFFIYSPQTTNCLFCFLLCCASPYLLQKNILCWHNHCKSFSHTISKALETPIKKMLTGCCVTLSPRMYKPHRSNLFVCLGDKFIGYHAVRTRSGLSDKPVYFCLLHFGSEKLEQNNGIFLHLYVGFFVKTLTMT